MAKDYDDFLEEEEFCFNCGSDHYTPSKTPGLCLDCMIGVTSRTTEEQYA